MKRTGINWLLKYDLVKVNIMLPCVRHEGIWGEWCYNYTHITCSQLQVMDALSSNPIEMHAVAYPGILFGEGTVQQIQLRTEDRENGDLGAVAP